MNRKTREEQEADAQSIEITVNKARTARDINGRRFLRALLQSIASQAVDAQILIDAITPGDEASAEKIHDLLDDIESDVAKAQDQIADLLFPKKTK
jgi:hypothetical protein